MKKLIHTLLLASGCQKDDLPADVAGTPEFSSVFCFMGQTYNLSAGQTGLILSSITVSEGAGYTFHSLLSNPACVQCWPEIAFSVQSPDSFEYVPPMSFTEAINAWDYTFDPDTLALSALTISATSGFTHAAGNWCLNGALINAAPTDSIRFELTQPGSYDVTFENSMQDCNLTTSRSIYFDGESVPCFVNLRQLDTIPNYYFANPGPTFDANSAQYVWTVNGNLMSEFNGPDLYVDSIFGIQEICVSVSDASGCSASACQSMNGTSNAENCVTNILFEHPELSAVNTSEAMVNLKFRDSSDELYVSDSGAQTGSFILLLSAENYTEPRMPDRSFVKVVFQINCFLYDTPGNGFPFSGQIVTAFEVP